jgi:GT2 family glycosyltransferase
MNITIVVVLYNLKVEDSKTIQSLRKLFNQCEEKGKFQLYLYDNSVNAQEFDSKVLGDLNTYYIHDNRNLGIATAYNYAFDKAKENGSDWLLLLDHDTELTKEYLLEIENSIQSIDHNVVAVVPQIVSENTMISPVSADSLRPLSSQRPQAGLQTEPVMAINSGAFIRVSFLEEMNGFNEEFPLDYLDHWLFYEIYQRGYRVWVMESCLGHDLSVMNYDNVSLNRYRSILDSEILFYKQYKKELLPSYRIQLVKRLAKQLLVVKNKKIAAYTIRCLFSL